MNMLTIVLVQYMIQSSAQGTCGTPYGEGADESMTA